MMLVMTIDPVPVVVVRAAAIVVSPVIRIAPVAIIAPWIISVVPWITVIAVSVRGITDPDSD
jgi:hypothetical protein